MYNYSHKLVYLILFSLITIVVLLIALRKLAIKTWHMRWELTLPFYHLFTFSEIAWIKNKLVPIIWLISIIFDILPNCVAHVIYAIFWPLNFFMGIDIPFETLWTFFDKIPFEISYFLNIIVWLVLAIIMYKIYKKFNWNTFWSMIGSVSIIFFGKYVLPILNVLTGTTFAVIFVYLCRIIAVIAMLVLCFSKKFQYVEGKELNNWQKIDLTSSYNLVVSNKKNKKWCIIIALILLIWIPIFHMNEQKTVHDNIFYEATELEDYSKNNKIVINNIKNEEYRNNFISKEIYDQSLSRCKWKYFWHEKAIQECINQWEKKIIWYGLICDFFDENLSDCEERIAFSWKHYFYNSSDEIEYFDIMSNKWLISSSHWWFDYSKATKEIVMNDIGNWNLFYDLHVLYDYNYENKDKLEIIHKYLWVEIDKDIWDYNVIEYAKDNFNGTYTYYIYITQDKNILYKNSYEIIDKNTARKIMSDYIWLKENEIININLDAEKYYSNFFWKWHNYSLKVNAKDWSIIETIDNIDIGKNAATEIAMKDAWIRTEDLLKNDFLSLPIVWKEWDWNDAIYNIKITTLNDKIYNYEISAYDGKIIKKDIEVKI